MSIAPNLFLLCLSFLTFSHPLRSGLSRHKFCKCDFWSVMRFYRLYCLLVKEHTAAMSWKSRKTDDFEFCIDLRTVICDLQHFAVECCALVDPQPFSVHVGENAAERVVDQPFERQLFQFRQRLIAIPKDPIHRRVFLAEHHFNVCKGKRHMVKAGVETVVPLPRGGSVIVLQCLTDLLPLSI